jgi:hypothetical protein
MRDGRRSGLAARRDRLALAEQTPAESFGGVPELAAGVSRSLGPEDRAEVFEARAATERDDGERVDREEKHGEVDRPSPEAEHRRIVAMSSGSREIPRLI